MRCTCVFISSRRHASNEGAAAAASLRTAPKYTNTVSSSPVITSGCNRCKETEHNLISGVRKRGDRKEAKVL